MSESQKNLLLLKPRGFCAGVVRAIDIVRIALEAFGPPIYVRKEIVHNRFVVEELQAKGAIFVDSVEEVPEGERVIYSAHGVSPEVRDGSHLRKLRVIDATCPLVTKVHVEAVKFAKEGFSLILIGHRDHDIDEHVMRRLAEQADKADARMPDRIGDRALGGLGGVLAMDVDAHAHFSDTAPACHLDSCRLLQ